MSAKAKKPGRVSPSTLKTTKDLRFDAENAREITPEAMEGLKSSLGEFGDISGITFNTRTGQLVAGHQRVAGLVQQHGHMEIVRTGEGSPYFKSPGGEIFPIRIVDWEMPRQRVANIAANNPHIAGHFSGRLKGQLKEIQKRSEGLFASLRLNQLEAQERFSRRGKVKPDDAPEPPKKAKTKPGDLYILGKHRLLCGDSTKPDAVGILMDGEKACLVNTDPPYGIAYTDDARVAAERAHGRQGRKQKWAGGIKNDNLLDGKKLQEFLEASIRTCLPHIRKGAPFYLWHPMLTQGTFFAAAAAAAAADILISRQIIWVKPSLLFGFGDYHWRHELCFYGWIRGTKPKFYGKRNQTTVWEITHDTSNGKRVHPTQKPVQLFEIPIHNHTIDGEIIYEPFCGSGSQLIAAESANRRCFAMELDPINCDVIVERWQNMTGKKAEVTHAR